MNKQLQAAIHREMVDGNPKAAIEMYRKIVARPADNRAAAATRQKRRAGLVLLRYRNPQ